MTLALPPGPARAPRRQIFVGTALACVAGTMLIGGQLAIWSLIRQRAVDAGERFPASFEIPEVASNVMLMTLYVLCLFAQWTVYSVKRGDRMHAGLSLGIVATMGVAFINAQAYVYHVMEMPVADGGYPGMFYAITATMLALVGIGLGFTAVTAFRALGGRGELELVSAHALYWYFVAAAFSGVWFLVYVTK
ncbi:MAG: cytochrome c oxidase subunit 3 [Ilumatobacteraceae bacterium]